MRTCPCPTPQAAPIARGYFPKEPVDIVRIRKTSMQRSRIAEAREAKGWTQREFAKRLDTTQQQVSRYESGGNDIKSNMIIKMSKVLDVSVSYLLGLDEPTLSSDEAELIRYFRQMRLEQKATVLAAAKTFAAESNRK